MLAPIQNKQSNSGNQALKIPFANSKKNVDENVAYYSNFKSNVGAKRQNNNNARGDVTSYQQEYQYQAYFKEHKLKSEYINKANNSISNSSERSFHLNFQHQIVFLNGAARYKALTLHQIRRYRWIVSGQFSFARKMFEIWIAQVVNWLTLRLSKNNHTLLVYQIQSLMFKVFLPPPLKIKLYCDSIIA